MRESRGLNESQFPFTATCKAKSTKINMRLPYAQESQKNPARVWQRAGGVIFGCHAHRQESMVCGIGNGYNHTDCIGRWGIHECGIHLCSSW